MLDVLFFTKQPSSVFPEKMFKKNGDITLSPPFGRREKAFYSYAEALPQNIYKVSLSNRLHLFFTRIHPASPYSSNLEEFIFITLMPSLLHDGAMPSTAQKWHDSAKRDHEAQSSVGVRVGPH